MDDFYDDDSFDVTDDSLNSDNYQHGFNLLQCYKILRILKTKIRRDVL